MFITFLYWLCGDSIEKQMGSQSFQLSITMPTIQLIVTMPYVLPPDFTVMGKELI